MLYDVLYVCVQHIVASILSGMLTVDCYLNYTVETFRINVVSAASNNDNTPLSSYCHMIHSSRDSIIRVLLSNSDLTIY